MEKENCMKQKIECTINLLSSSLFPNFLLFLFPWPLPSLLLPLTLSEIQTRPKILISSPFPLLPPQQKQIKEISQRDHNTSTNLGKKEKKGKKKLTCTRFAAGRSRRSRRRRRRGVRTEDGRYKLSGAGGNHPSGGNEPTRVFRNRRFQTRTFIGSSGAGDSTTSRYFSAGSGLGGPANPKNGGHGVEERERDRRISGIIV